MRQIIKTPACMPVALAVILFAALPIGPALGQTESATTLVSVDTPAEGATLIGGTRVDVGGWAVDAAGPGSGVDTVRIYLDGPMEAGGNLLGAATYGRARPDVAEVLGNPAFANAGFDYVWNLTGVSGGSHTLFVYAHSLASGWTHKAVNVTVRVASTPTPSPAGERHVGPYPVPPSGLWPYPGYPPYPIYPPDPPYPPPSYPGTPPGGKVCIMIYPPPPECLYP